MRRNVLLLQGPVGPFFARFSRELKSRGFNVYKVNFNGGDAFFYRGKNTINFTGKMKEWEAYLERLVQNKEIGRIYLFGDCRAYHRIAKEVALRHRIRIFVFEEGYIRPDYITLEENGVNGHSSMMHAQIDTRAHDGKKSVATLHPKRVFMRTAWFSILYYVVASLRSKKFRYYQHHRGFSPAPEGSRWIVSAFRKWRFARKERSFLSEQLPPFEGNYFVCPLQVHCDMQVGVHSEYNSIEEFIGEIIGSFAATAPSNKALVFKHHPLDRGYKDYTILFNNLINEHGLQGRVFYVHDVCLPSLLQNAEGTVLINSTVGMSSLFHGTPVKALGRAIYDLPELTYQGSLNRFWSNPDKVDKQAFERFREYLITQNQINGSFYRRLTGVANAPGIIWSPCLSRDHEYVEAGPDAASMPQLKIVGGLGTRQNPRPVDDKLDDLDVA